MSDISSLKGFGSHDAKRRDEFANAIRTEQFRATIAKESQAMSRNSENLQESLTKLMEDRANRTLTQTTSQGSLQGTGTLSGRADFSYSSQVPQYDIGRSRVTPFDPKSIKDTYYRQNIIVAIDVYLNDVQRSSDSLQSDLNASEIIGPRRLI